MSKVKELLEAWKYELQQGTPMTWYDEAWIKGIIGRLNYIIGFCDSSEESVKDV